MNINRQNYELFAADFLDGNLSPSETAEFMAFLAENKDIADEIDLIRQLEPTIGPEKGETDFSFLLKDLNYIEVNDENFEEMCIAYYEGDLNEDSKKKLLKFISENSIRKQKFNLFGQLKIQPDKSIVYNRKSKLKQDYTRYPKIQRLALITSFAAAASIALFLIFRHPETGQQEPYVNKMSQQDAKQSESLVQKDIVKESGIIRANIPNEVSKKREEIETVNIPFNGEKIIAAVSDSTDDEQDDFIQISLIEPKIIRQEVVLDSAQLFKSSTLYTLAGNYEEKPLEEIKEKTSTILLLADNLTVNDVIKSGINGINKMVEGDLNYRSATNKEGKITEFALSSESFNIKRKIRSN